MDKIFIIENGIKFMKIKGYHFPDGWIEACLQWLFEEHSHEFNKVSLEQWYSLIEQQWLFTDLKDLEMSSLLGTHNVMENNLFNGIICLQIMQFEDVSKSYYGQLQNIDGLCNPNTEVGNEEEKHTSRRALQLHLTDGLNKIIGFEFELWTNIRTFDLWRGCKVQLKGPFKRRNGIAFLKQRNIIVLGGEVEDWKTISQVPFLEKLLESNINKQQTSTQNKTRPGVYRQTRIKPESKKESLSRNETPVLNEICPIQIMPIPDNNPTTVTLTNVIAHCQTYTSPKVDLKSEIGIVKPEYSVKSSIHSTKINTQETQIDFEDDDDEFLKLVEEIPEVTTPVTSQGSANVDRDEEPCTSLIDIFRELESPESDNIVTKQYRVKAMIVKFLTKLTTDIDSDGQYHWKLQLRISDGTSSLDCQLSDGFMSSKIGFSASSFHKKKKSNNIEEMKIKIKEFQNNIVRCNCGLYTLKLSESCDKIEVVGYADIGGEEVADIRLRVSQLT